MRAASIRFCARVEEDDGEHRCVRHRLLLLPPTAGMVERLLQRLPEVHTHEWLAECVLLGTCMPSSLQGF